MTFENKENPQLSLEELERYSRHIVIPEIGENGQKKLKDSSVLCVGCGGLGSPVLIYLAAAGVGHIGIVDDDLVETSNLQRQVIHSTKSIGNLKTSSAKSRILEINPNCNVQVFNTSLNTKNVLGILKYFDLTCDCTDNFQSRYLISDACTILRKPHIYGAIEKFEGHATVFNLNHESPSFRDLIPQAPSSELLPSCSEAGVLGVLPGIIGVIQATEAIKIITGQGNVLNGRLLVINALKMQFRELHLKKDPRREPIKRIKDNDEFNANKGIDKESFKSISVNTLKDLLENHKEKIILIDVRNKNEYKLQSIAGSLLIPLAEIESGRAIDKIKKLGSNKEIYIHCKSGMRSKKAILNLKKYGLEATNIDGGIDLWNKKIKKPT